MSFAQSVFASIREFFHVKSRADAFLVFLALGATLLIAVAVYWTLDRIEVEVKQRTAESLKTVVSTTQEGIAFWVNSVENPVSIIARRPEVVSAVQSQIQLSTTASLLRQSSALRDLRDFLS